MMPYINNASTFLVSIIFGLFLWACMLRLLLQWVQADYYNPISQFVVRFTNPAVTPLKRFFPVSSKFDLSVIALLLILQILELFIIGALNGELFGLIGLLIISIGQLLKLAADIFFFSIMIVVILSWVNPGGYNPIIVVIEQLASPVLKPVRRYIPAVSGFDLSPIAAIVGLQLIEMLIIAPIIDAGRAVI